jgi:quercetin dioxygenase-like cupin family protein
MTDPTQPELGHRRPHTSALAGTFLESDLNVELARLHDESTWSSGQNARTLIKYDDFRVVLLALQAHARMAEHKAEGRISIHVLTGHLRLSASGRTFDLRPGSLLALDRGVPHSVEAIEESALLLTIAQPQ